MSRKIEVTDITNGEIKIFNSIIECARSLGLTGKTSITNRLNGKIKSPFRKKYKFSYLEESVSTIPDECKEVESEIGTDSKRTTIER